MSQDNHRKLAHNLSQVVLFKLKTSYSVLFILFSSPFLTENLNDGVANPPDAGEAPWEIIPRFQEFAYENPPTLEQDDTTLYGKKKHEIRRQVIN